jgi:hypothetical protein
MAKPEEKEKLLASVISAVNMMGDADLEKTAAFIKELEIVIGKTKMKGVRTKNEPHTENEA